MATCLILQTKLCWNTAMSISLHTVYGCFRAATIELKSCDRDRLACKA